MDLPGKEKIMGEIYNELTKNQGLTSYNTTNIAELNKANFDISLKFLILSLNVSKSAIDKFT